MKKIAKILSAGLSALMLISVPCITAGAVSENCVNNADIIAALKSCDLSGCGDIQSILSRIPCDGSCNISDLENPNSSLSQLLNDGNCNIDSLIGLLQQGRECPGGDCNKAPSQSVPDSGAESEPKPTPAVPSEKPQSPAEKPSDSVSAPSVDSGFNAAYEDEVIRMVNIERSKYGLSALQKDQGAASVAHVRAKEIVQSFSHTRPDGSSCFTAAKELGVSYSAAGENIAYGYADPQQVVNGWMNSEGHRKNILSSSFSKIGVGCYSSGNVLYWSQFFIG